MLRELPAVAYSCEVAITGDELRETRARYGDNQAAFADRLGVSARTIVTWERDGVPRNRELTVLRVIGPQLTRVRRDISAQEYYESDQYLEDLERSHAQDEGDYSSWVGDTLYGKPQRALAEVGARLEDIDTEDIVYELLRRQKDPRNEQLREWKAMFFGEDTALRDASDSIVSPLSDDELRNVPIDELRKSDHALVAGDDQTTDDEDDVTP